MDELAFASATELVAKLAAGDISSLELTDHYIRRIEAFDDRTNAVVVRIFDRARAAAREADTQRRAGRQTSPLGGLPMTIKESFAVSDTPTTFGFEAFADNIAESDAVVTERLTDAGAIILGKTNVPPGLMDGQSANPIYGRTANPWDLDRTPGGSSGGSAAAVAAGYSALDFGSDIASSIRNPAHFCGIFGHKPTYGICPGRGHSLRPEDISVDIGVFGPLARSASDLELALSIVAGPDEREARAWKLALPRSDKRQLSDFKVSLLLDDPFAEVDEEVASLLDALGSFLEREGSRVVRGARPAWDSRELYGLYMVLLRAAASDPVSEEDAGRARDMAQGVDRFSQDTASLNAYGVSLSHRDWLKLNAERERLRRDWAAFFAEHDLVLCPPLSTAAFPHIDGPPQGRTLDVNGRAVPFENQLFWAGFAGVAYLPASVAPIGQTPAGLPVGVQIIGPEYRDLECLRFASLLEANYRKFEPPPAFARAP